MVNGRIQLLDCTLRDGGLGLDDIRKYKVSEASFDDLKIDKTVHYLKESRIDIVELGSIEITEVDKRDVAIYQNIESISEIIPKNRPADQIYAALYRGPDTPIKDIPHWNESFCEAIRVIIRYSELQKSLDFCGELAKKGYKVFVQPMVTMRYTNDEIQQLIHAANDMGAYALYIVDSYGYMQADDVATLFDRFNMDLHPSIRIGFHAHNNMGLAFSNVLSFVNQHSDRDIIIDSSILGMGQGAGNLQTEVIANHMNCYHEALYEYDAVLEACEVIEGLWTRNIWGYSVARLLSAIHKTAYKFSTALRDEYGLSYTEINKILTDIPDAIRHRYTPENTITLLKMSGYGVPRKKTGISG